MSTIKRDKNGLLWLRPLETAGAQYDDCVRRAADRFDLRTAESADDDDDVEWLVIEGLIRAWQAPRDS
jgi:hypothetical protein